MSRSFFNLVRSHGNALTPYQLAAETGWSIPEAQSELHRYGSKVPGAKVVLTATTLTQRAQVVKEITQKRARGMSLKKSPSADESHELQQIEIAKDSALNQAATKEATIYEAVFVFPEGAETKYLSASFWNKATDFTLTKIAPTAFFVVQFLFGFSLLLSILAITTAIILLIIIMLNKSKGGGGGGGGGCGDCFSGGGGPGGGGGARVNHAPDMNINPTPSVHVHHHYGYDLWWWDRLLWDLTRPPLYIRHYERDAYRREVELGPIGAARVEEPSSSSSSSSKPSSDGSSGSGTGGNFDGQPNSMNHPSGVPGGIPRFPPREGDDADDEPDEEAGGGGAQAGAGGGNAKVELNWFQSIFSFVFGNGRPKCPGDRDFETIMWLALANKIRANGGTILAEEAKPFVLDSASDQTVAQQMSAYAAEPSSAASAPAALQIDDSKLEENDERAGLLLANRSPPRTLLDPNTTSMLPILSHFRGVTLVGPGGGESGGLIAYHFPTLAAQHHRLRELGPGGMGDSDLEQPVNYVREPLWTMSHCTEGQVKIVTALGIFNLFIVSIFPSVVRWTQNIEFVESTPEEAEKLGEIGLFFDFAFWLCSLIWKLYPMLLGYAIGFFAIPLGRWFLIKYLNTRIVARNMRRKAWARMMRFPLAAFRVKRDLARSLIVDGAFASSSSGDSLNDDPSSLTAPRNAFVPASSSSASAINTSVVYESVSRKQEEETRAWERMQLLGEAGAAAAAVRPHHAPQEKKHT